MFWRKRTTEEEIDELKLFVDGMKRGQTPATGDSLLETLRQIHDRREAPVVGHDHKRMLAERLRRQMRQRNGEPVDDTVRVPEFAIAAPRRRFLEWAVAASLVFHAGLGIVALEHLRFGRIFAIAGSEETGALVTPEQPPIVRLVLPPVVDRRASSGERPTLSGPASAGRPGFGRETSPGPLAGPGASPVHSMSSAPVGPPVLPGGGAPIVAGYLPAGLEGQADHGLPEGSGPSLGAPPAGNGDRPESQIGGVSFDRSDEVEREPDVPARRLNRPTPIYTSKALEYQITGKVRVSALIASDGTIGDLRVTRSLGYGLDEAAIDAVRRMKFSPAMRNGVPVKVRVYVDVEFNLR